VESIAVGIYFIHIPIICPMKFLQNRVKDCLPGSNAEHEKVIST